MKNACCVIILIFIKLNLTAQIYHYTSNRFVVTDTNTNNSTIHATNKAVSFTIDAANKKIMMEDSTGMTVYKIVSSKFTNYDGAGTERHEYKCIDKKGSIQIINLVLFTENLQKNLRVSGQFEITIGTFSTAYDLRKKT